MFTEKDLVAGETVLVWKESDVKVLYLGTIEDLNKHFTIEQPKSNAVQLENKVYDFVPVRCRDDDDDVWKNFRLVAVVGNKINRYPYTVINEDGYSLAFRYCEFINQQ